MAGGRPAGEAPQASAAAAPCPLFRAHGSPQQPFPHKPCPLGPSRGRPETWPGRLGGLQTQVLTI